MLIDSHAHLADEKLFIQIADVLKRAQEAHIETIVNICTNRLTAERGLELANQHPWIVNVGSTTPHDAEKEGEALFPYFSQLAKEKKLVAVGETGLDYYYEHASRSIQKKLFSQYLDLAVSCNLPVVIHCRDAFEDLFSMCDLEYRDRPLLLHCFTGDKESAKKALDRGWKISLSGIVTFKKSVVLQEVAKYVPLEELLVETDAPYLAPESKRGNINEPSFIVETVKKLAELKNLSFVQVAYTTSSNAKSFFRLKN